MRNRIIRKIFFVFIAVILLLQKVFLSVADTKVDSLTLLASKEKDIASKASLYRSASVRIKDTSPDSGIILGKIALQLYKKANNIEGILTCYTDLASIHAEYGIHDISIIYADSLYALALNRNDSSRIMIARNIQGTVLISQGRFEHSSELLFDALKFISQRKQKLDCRLHIYNNLVILFNETGRHEQAVEFALIEYQTAKEWDNNLEVIYACNNLVDSYLYQGKQMEAKPYLDEMNHLMKNETDINLILLVAAQNGHWNYEAGKYEDAVINFQEALRLNKNLIDREFQCVVWNNLGSCYQKLGRYREAEEAINNSLKISAQINSRKERKWSYELLMTNAALQHNFSKAYAYSLLMHHLSDSLLNEKSQETILNLKTKYDSDEQKRQIDLLKKESELHQVQLRKHRSVITGILASSIILLSIGWILLKQYKLKRKIENQEALLSERKRISADLHDDIGATLGSISIFCQVAKNKILKKESPEDVIDKIGFASRDMIDKMNDLVWSINPDFNNTEELVNRMQSYAAHLLTSQEISFTFLVPDGVKGLKLSHQNRKNVFLIFKEAVHNVVKYAQAKTVTVKMTYSDAGLSIEITDDGKGFNFSDTAANGGNGLKNMKARARESGAVLNVESANGAGTAIRLLIKHTA